MLFWYSFNLRIDNAIFINNDLEKNEMVLAVI